MHYKYHLLLWKSPAWKHWSLLLYLLSPKHLCYSDFWKQFIAHCTSPRNSWNLEMTTRDVILGAVHVLKLEINRFNCLLHVCCLCSLYFCIKNWQKSIRWFLKSEYYEITAYGIYYRKRSYLPWFFTLGIFVHKSAL